VVDPTRIVELDRRGSLEDGIVGEVDLTHASFALQAD
jgi:hypothetical protein